MSGKMNIDKVENGYVITLNGTRIAATLEDVFDYLLLHFEGRASTFNGDSYGTVVIVRCRCGEANRVDRKSAQGCSNCSSRLSQVA